MMKRMSMVISRPEPHMIQKSEGSQSRNIVTKPVVSKKTNRSMLMEPMVSRVHMAKPGCSACGKKKGL